jgi:S-adenosylmethionine hydrolase
LTIDFGIQDGFLAIMKGVIYAIVPNVKAEVRGITESYGHKNPDDLIAVVDSEDYIEIAMVNGDAAQKLGAKVGDVVEVIYEA